MHRKMHLLYVTCSKVMIILWELSSGFRGQGCIEIMNMQTATMNGIQVFYTFLNFSITHILKTGLFQVHVYLMNISCNLSTVIQMNTL